MSLVLVLSPTLSTQDPYTDLRVWTQCYPNNGPIQTTVTWSLPAGRSQRSLTRWQSPPIITEVGVSSDWHHTWVMWKITGGFRVIAPFTLHVIKTQVWENSIRNTEGRSHLELILTCWTAFRINWWLDNYCNTTNYVRFDHRVWQKKSRLLWETIMAIVFIVNDETLSPCNITHVHWCLYRHLCILPERFGKKGQVYRKGRNVTSQT